MRREVRSGRDPGVGGTLMELYPCSGSRAPQAGHTVLPSAFIFGAGLLGNLIALLILWLHKLRFRRGAAASLFYVLVTGLTVTDLLGKCLVSPLVLLSYARNRTLTGLTGGRGLCELFAFSMAFFGLASTLLLLAMALERWLSLGRPYLYRRLLGARAGALLVPAVYLASLLFCGLPFLGFGHYEQYCPGTWCFFRTTEKGLPAGVLPGFSVLYGTVMGVLVLAVVLCNASVMRHLLRMYRRQSRRGGVGSAAPAATGVEEIDQFILLALMTVLFAVCSLPLTVRTYIGAFAADFDEDADLLALRFLSLNSVVDPWVFIIFRTSVVRTYIHALYCALQSKKSVQTELLREAGSRT